MVEKVAKVCASTVLICFTVWLNVILIGAAYQMLSEVM